MKNMLLNNDLHYRKKMIIRIIINGINMDTKTCLLPFKNSYPGLKGTEQNVNRVYSCNDKGINALGATQQPKTTDCCVHIPKFKIAQSKFKNASCVCVHLQTVKL